MSKSMTAYARICFPSFLGTLVLEIHSVNRKGLEFALHLQREFLRFDIDLRKWLSVYIERGQVTVRLFFQTQAQSCPTSAFYLDELKRLKKEWVAASQELALDVSAVDLPFLVSQMQSSVELRSSNEEEEFRSVLKAAVETALKDLMRMKHQEGDALVKDMDERLNLIEESLILIEARKEIPLIHYSKKMRERLQEMTRETLDREVEERLAREVALLAEKMDITEELVRLRVHIKQMKEYLHAPLKSAGKTLDFLAQEMHREINTLGSKSQDSEIASLVIKMKGELDRIREQVQNIE